MAALTALLLVGWHMASDDEHAGRPTVGAAGASSGSELRGRARGTEARRGDPIQRREAEPARNFVEEWFLDGPSEPIRRAAQAAEDVSDKLALDDLGWARFLNEVADPFPLHDVVERCGPEYDGADVCYMNLNLVVDSKDGGSASGSQIVFAAVESTDPSTIPCRKYASCIARGFLGRDLSALPGDGAGPEGLLITWAMTPWDDERIQVNSDKIERCIARATEDIIALGDEDFAVDNEASREYQRGTAEARLAWCEWLLAQLES